MNLSREKRSNFLSFIIRCVLIMIVGQSLFSCMLKEDVDIDFPESEKQIMLEAYLCPGKNYELILMETNKLSEDLILQLSWNADATISNEEKSVHLLNILNIEKETGYVFNYGSSAIVPYNEKSNYYLEITTQLGAHIKASTELVSDIKINDILEEDKKINVYFTGDETPEQRYYSLLIEGYEDGEYQEVRYYMDASETNEIDLTYTVKANFYKWNTLTVKLFHITSDNYHFQVSVQKALSANLDPFTVPDEIKSNIDGAMGIFTYFKVDSIQVR